MSETKRKELQDLYIRTCRDSGFGLDSVQAATLVAQMIGCSPLEIWMAMPCLSVMDEIASGKHPAVPPLPVKPERTLK